MVHTDITDLELMFDSHSSPPLSESVLIFLNSMDSIQGVAEDATGSEKTFPDIPTMRFPNASLWIGIPVEWLCIPTGIG